MGLPVGDEGRKKSGGIGKLQVSYNSPVILTFAVICLITLILNLITRGSSNHLLFVTYRTSFKDPMMYVRFFTHIFGHADFEHFLANMGYVLLIGPLLEEKYGSKKLLSMILVTAFITGLLNAIFFPHTGLLGASGVVFMFIMLASITEIKDRKVPLSFILIVIIYLGQQVYDGIFVADNISQFAHIVGGIAGSVMGFFMGGKKTEG